MRRIFTVMFFMCAATGCKNVTRAPICPPGQFNFPPEAEGRYRISMPMATALNPTVTASIDEMEFDLRIQQSFASIDVDKSSFTKTQRMPFAKTLFNRLQFVAKNEKDITAPSFRFAVPAAVCKLGGEYIYQDRKSDGTFAFSRLDILPNSINLVDLMFPAEELEKRGIAYHSFPVGLTWSSQGGWGSNMIPESIAVVDNAGFSIDQNVELLRLARPLATAFVLNRIPESEQKKKRAGEVVRILMSNSY